MACLAIALSEMACFGPASTGRIITAYREAACIPLSARPQILPRTREWNTVLSLRDGLKVVVRGAQIPGGRITVFYPDRGNEVVAADAGDYVYPSDVRVDAQKEVLYVKAEGLAGGISQETWLFEYDIRQQRLLDRLRVVNSVLTEECPQG
jgi:hypothetical protein